MISITYQQYFFSIRCEEGISFVSLPTFIFRSVLGNQLKRMSCLLKGTKCGDCSLKKTCVYSFLFESPIEKTVPVLKGRNKAPHPFTLYSPTKMHNTTSSVELLITLFGKGIEYFPYLFFALKRAGEQGIFKKRTRFLIESVKCQGRELIIDDEHIDTTIKPLQWYLVEEEGKPADTQSTSIEVNLLSPLRIKYMGSYGADFSYIDFINSIQRRVSVMSTFYGSNPKSTYINKDIGKQINISRRNLKWKDFSYFSSRQRDRLRMGGVLGSFEIEGPIPKQEKTLLRGAQIFHAGKNPVFGFGKIAVKGIGM